MAAGKGQVGESLKKSVIYPILPLDSRYLQKVESVKIGKLEKVMANRQPDWRPRWLPPFEHPNFFEIFCKTQRSKSLFCDTPNDSDVNMLSPNGNKLYKSQASAQKDG